jgi:hypothetical protein
LLTRSNHTQLEKHDGSHKLVQERALVVPVIDCEARNTAVLQQVNVNEAKKEKRESPNDPADPVRNIPKVVDVSALEQRKNLFSQSVCVA